MFFEPITGGPAWGHLISQVTRVRATYFLQAKDQILVFDTGRASRRSRVGGGGVRNTREVVEYTRNFIHLVFALLA